MTDWQPIETAPKDGAIVFVSDPEVATFLMRWAHIQRNEFFAPNQVGMWVTPDGKTTWAECRESGPTRWMLLPAPPINSD